MAPDNDTLERRSRLLAIGEALTRAQVAIEQLEKATHNARRALPTGHPAADAIIDAETVTRQARAKLEIALRRMP